MKTIKDIYNWKLIDNPETTLLKHVNRVLMKTPNELDVSDVCMLLRQEMFLDIVIPKALKLIETESSIGDYYDYQMLVNLADVSRKNLLQYRKELKKLVEFLSKEFPNTIFEIESDKTDYQASMTKIVEKIS